MLQFLLFGCFIKKCSTASTKKYCPVAFRPNCPAAAKNWLLQKKTARLLQKEMSGWYKTKTGCFKKNCNRQPKYEAAA